MTQLQQAEQCRVGGTLWPRGKSFKAALTVANVRDSEGKVVDYAYAYIYEPKQTELELERNSFDPNFNPSRHGYLELSPQTPNYLASLSGLCEAEHTLKMAIVLLVGVSGTHDAFGIDCTTQTYQATALSEVQVCFKSETQMILPQINQRLQQTEAF